MDRIVGGHGGEQRAVILDLAPKTRAGQDAGQPRQAVGVKPGRSGRGRSSGGTAGMSNIAISCLKPIDYRFIFTKTDNHENKF